MSTMIVLDGLAVLALRLTAETKVECRPDGLALRHPPTGLTTFILTDNTPEPGAKVLALDPLGPLWASPFVGHAEPGGGVVRSGMALMQRCRAERSGGAVHLFNSGTGMPELEELCAREGMFRTSLARQTTPIDLIIPPANLGQPTANRIIVKGRTEAVPGVLDDAQRQAIARVSNQAQAVVSVSSKDGPLTAASVAAGNGARRYFQPPGSLSPELNQLLLLTVHEVICNFEEWCRLGRDAGLVVPEVGEDSPEASVAAAALLRSLHRCHWAGTEAAVCTLGRHGIVVADWLRDHIDHIALEFLDGEAEVPTPAGAGDRFLGEWIYWRETWSRQGHLRDPLAANGLRTVHAVAQALGLRRDRYDAATRRC